ncbi:MAG: hypothetical protein V4517_20335 [Pseudomonadota bacterium]
MGWFDWLKPKPRSLGPTPEGLYGKLPGGARWTGGPDPAGDPGNFIPRPGDYVFDISEWRWEEQLWIEATTGAAGDVAGFGLVVGVSDGSATGGAELWQNDGRGGQIYKETQEWIIPRGLPTQELVLVSHGERTTRVLRTLERCFGYEPLAHPALPDKTAVSCELLMLRGIVRPDEGRFTARMKVVLAENDGRPYCEFYLNVNSVLKQLWLSEKSDEYRIAILTWIFDPSRAA